MSIESYWEMSARSRSPDMKCCIPQWTRATFLAMFRATVFLTSPAWCVRKNSSPTGPRLLLLSYVVVVVFCCCYSCLELFLLLLVLLLHCHSSDQQQIRNRSTADFGPFSAHFFLCLIQCSAIEIRIRFIDNEGNSTETFIYRDKLFCST